MELIFGQRVLAAIARGPWHPPAPYSVLDSNL